MAAVAEAKLDLRESPDQLWWRQLFWDDMDAAAATGNGNGPHKECQLFLANTELRLITDVSKSQHDREQVVEWLVMGWDKEGEGVWVWEPNPRTFQQILEIYHTRGSYCGWLDALERCGAVHYKHYNDNGWTRAVCAQITEDDPNWKPYVQKKRYLDRGSV